MARPKWQDLPSALLINVFKLLPVKDQLQAGLVCRSWQPPADAACEQITLLGGSLDHLRALLWRWMPRRGHEIQELCLQLQRGQILCRSQSQLQLPSKLRSLQLLGGAFQVLPLPPTAPSCLTKLVLQQQTLRAPAASAPATAQLLLHALHELTSLQHLTISIRSTRRYAISSSTSTTDLCAVLEAVAGSGRHLTSLELQGMEHLQLPPQQPVPQQQAAAAAQQVRLDGAQEQQQQQQYLAQFTKLQELTLELPDGRCLGGIEQIDSLTKLSLIATSNFFHPLLSPGDSSSIGCLTNLQSLSVLGGRCSAAAVLDITSLTSLMLTSQAPDRFHGGQWDAALWGWLERLPLLSLSFSARVAGGDQDAAGYAALTASSSLQRLDLSGALLPEGVLQHLFPEGHQRQQLHSLCLPSCLQGNNPLQAGDVQALMRCCGAAFRHLDGGQVLPFTPALTSLTQLTYLSVTQARRAADELQLGNMTQLLQCKITNDSQHKLKWRCCDIQPLKKLSRLTSLELAGGTLSDDTVQYLTELKGLAQLTVPSLAEELLVRLAEEMPGLTSLSFGVDKLGALLIDRLAWLDPRSFDLQESVREPHMFNSNGQPYLPWLRSCIQRITIISKAPAGSAVMVPYAVSDISNQLGRCFTSNIQQISQERASLQNTIATQQTQLQQLRAKMAGLTQKRQQQQELITTLKLELGVAECFIDADKMVLRDQLKKEKEQRQQLERQLKDGQEANQELQLQLQNQQETKQALQLLEKELEKGQAENGVLQLQLQSQQADIQALQMQLAQLQLWAQQGALLTGSQQQLAVAAAAAGATSAGYMQPQAAAQQLLQQQSALLGPPVPSLPLSPQMSGMAVAVPPPLLPSQQGQGLPPVPQQLLPGTTAAAPQGRQGDDFDALMAAIPEA